MRRGPKPTYTRVRNEKMNLHIGRAIAKGQDDIVAALKYFAYDAGIELNYKEINDFEKIIRAELARQ